MTLFGTSRAIVVGAGSNIQPPVKPPVLTSCLTDTFNRTTSGSWGYSTIRGAPFSGHVAYGSIPSALSCNGSAALVSGSGGGAGIWLQSASSPLDVKVTCAISGAASLGKGFYFGLYDYRDTDYIEVDAVSPSNGSPDVTFNVFTFSNFNSFTLSGAYGQQVTIRIQQFSSGTYNVKAWTGATEPGTWNLSSSDATNAVLFTNPVQVGLYGQVTTGMTATFQNLTVISGISGFTPSVSYAAAVTFDDFNRTASGFGTASGTGVAWANTVSACTDGSSVSPTTATLAQATTSLLGDDEWRNTASGFWGSATAALITFDFTPGANGQGGLFWQMWATGSSGGDRFGVFWPQSAGGFSPGYYDARVSSSGFNLGYSSTLQGGSATTGSFPTGSTYHAKLEWTSNWYFRMKTWTGSSEPTAWDAVAGSSYTAANSFDAFSLGAYSPGGTATVQHNSIGPITVQLGTVTYTACT